MAASTRTWLILAVAGFVVLIHGAWWGFGDQMVARGVFADGDSYTRLIRAERLLQTGDWLDVSIPRANAPHGTSVHWTRPFDVVLLALALPLLPALGLKGALYWAGVVVSPLLHVVLGAVLAWTAVPLLGRAGAAVAGAVTAAQAGVLSFSLVGRADHHMMFACLAALATGCLIRSFAEADGGARAAVSAGLVIAAGLWIGPEFLVFMALVLAVAGLPWLAGEAGAGRRNVGLAGGLATGLVVAVLLERLPGGFLDISYDRVSVVHLGLALLLLLFWGVVHRVEMRLPSITLRTAVALAGAAGLLLTMHLVFPNFLGNPLVADADPAIGPIFAHISEYRPVTDVARFLVYFGSALFAGPWLVWRLTGGRGEGHLWSWLLLAAGLVLFTGMAMAWLRWCLYAALFLSIVLADVVVAADEGLSRRFRFPARVPAKVLVMLALAVGPLALGSGLLHAKKTPEERAAAREEACPIRLLAPLLGESPRTIVASANFGPELMYRTPHRVVATVHHRNIAGILDGHRILNGTDDAASRALAEVRGVDLVLLCPETSNDTYFLIGDADGSLYRRLVSGPSPDWLRPRALPADLAAKFRLFEVVATP